MVDLNAARALKTPKPGVPRFNHLLPPPFSYPPLESWVAMSDHWHHASSHIDPHGERPSRPETSVSYRTTRLSLNGRAVLIREPSADHHARTFLAI